MVPARPCDTDAKICLAKCAVNLAQIAVVERHLALQVGKPRLRFGQIGQNSVLPRNLRVQSGDALLRPVAAHLRGI